MTSLIHFTRIFLISLLIIVTPLQAGATTVLPVSLQQMSATAEFIFLGKVISNDTRIDDMSGQIATFTTFEVLQAVKGKPGTTHTIKQIGGQLPGSDYHLIIKGVPRFYLGKEYIVFLPEQSSLGFSSPIGLSQGKFDVLEKTEGKVVSNGRAAASLVGKTPSNTTPQLPSGIEIRSHSLEPVNGSSSQIRMDDFMQTVSGMINE